LNRSRSDERSHDDRARQQSATCKAAPSDCKAGSPADRFHCGGRGTCYWCHRRRGSDRDTGGDSESRRGLLGGLDEAHHHDRREDRVRDPVDFDLVQRDLFEYVDGEIDDIDY
jgi:hypothetical protein